MFDGRSADAMPNFAANSVQSLSESDAEAVYRVLDGKPADHRDRTRRWGASPESAIAEDDRRSRKDDSSVVA
jgi:hypothetical protein